MQKYLWTIINRNNQIIIVEGYPHCAAVFETREQARGFKKFLAITTESQYTRVVKIDSPRIAK